jgi:hypothetical protein
VFGKRQAIHRVGGNEGTDYRFRAAQATGVRSANLLHATPPGKTVVARGGLAATSSPSGSPTTFRNHARRLLPAKSMPPTSSVSSS